MTKRLFLLTFVFFNLFTFGYAKEATFCSSQILARPTTTGYTWTLASRLGKLLDMAETEYGERDKSWTILGTEFSDDEQPSNWHPLGFKKKNIVFLLTRQAASNKKLAMYQLAHEIIHALSPNDKDDSNYLEEGVATYFSIHATRKIGIPITTNYIQSSQYQKAYNLVETVYKAHPDAGKRIAKARKAGYLFSTLKKKQLMILFPKIDPSVAEQLATKF